MSTVPTSGPSIVWFRRDLRLSDNPAWANAVAAGQPICAMFIIDPELVSHAGPLRRELLGRHLAALDEDLVACGGRLRVERGEPSEVIARVVDEIGAAALMFNRDTTPAAQRRDATVESGFAGTVTGTWGSLVHPPGEVLTQAGGISKVFTPFYKAWDRTPWSPWPTVGPDVLPPPVLADPGTGQLRDLVGETASSEASQLEPPFGERGARLRLDRFDERADRYLDDRDFPAIASTSGLSADLRFGTISPRAVATHIGVASRGRAGFVRQLAWRDWYAHLLWDMPHLRTAPMKPEARAIAWSNNRDEFEAWRLGRTGYPIVDAGMRELLATGRMHNRLRMLTASFLVKDLLVDWRWGERWFRHQLIDGDVAQNVGNWQWAAGTGPDAAPFFRVFNPTLQSRKFDAEGEYIRRWVPELAGLSTTQIHEPSTVGPLELAAAGVVLGDTYPAPIVDHHWARDRALQAYGEAAP